MSEMVERVAKALHASLGYEARWPHPECTQCMDAARAAIAAMQEPTEAMIEVGSVWFYEGPTNSTTDAEDAWNAMIAAALFEEKAAAE